MSNRESRYAERWMKVHFGQPRNISEWEAAKYVAAMATYYHADAKLRKQLEAELDAMQEVAA